MKKLRHSRPSKQWRIYLPFHYKYIYCCVSKKNTKHFKFAKEYASADGLTLYFTCSVTSVTDQKLSDTRRPFSANLKKNKMLHLFECL